MDLSVQLYTVRNEAKIDLAGTLSRLKAIGFTRVELARIDFNEENAQIVKNSGLFVTSIQVKPKVLEKDFMNIVAFCRTTGCGLVVASVIPLQGILGGKKALENVAGRLSSLSLKYRKAGIRFAFHHHDFEFKKIHSVPKLQWLMEWTDPSVSFILDTYWVKKSGEEPLRWLQFLNRRVAGLHLRDCASGKRPSDTELGNGTIDFPALFQALPNSVSYGAIEQKSSRPWESLKTSFSYLQSLNQPNIHI
jgi:sugar phosphate isomerase/epimerase